MGTKYTRLHYLENGLLPLFARTFLASKGMVGQEEP